MPSNGPVARWDAFIVQVFSKDRRDMRRSVHYTGESLETGATTKVSKAVFQR